MDAPVDPELEPLDNAGHGLDNLPEVSRTLQTLEGQLPDVKRSKSQRKHLDVLQQPNYAVPASAMTDTVRPELQSRKSSKMSLFHLFSRPKVEKLRGYVEPCNDSLPGPPRTNSNSAPIQRVQPDADQGRLRPTTSKSYAGKGTRQGTSKETLSPLPPDRRPRSFDPPPLFQCWPQARKHGVFEVSSATPELVLQKSKSRTSGALFDQGNMSLVNIPGNRGSGSTMKSAIRQVSSPASVEKLFVLITSGFLLQYAKAGPSDRLPERILQLGKDSAAYASDLIPGKHHVLHVAHAVDHAGVTVATPQSLLSRFGIRNQAAKRMVSNFLLVMPGAQVMDEWMSSIRKEIESQGGKRLRSDSVSSKVDVPTTGDAPKIDLKKVPSQSHRYQVKRDPTKPSIITSPSADGTDAFLSPQPDQVNDSAATRSNSVATDSAEADSSGSEIPEAKARPRAQSDSHSISSSTRTSSEQQLDRLRNSVRASHSTVATSVTVASRTNSIISTPPPDQTLDMSEAAKDGLTTKAPYRGLSFYTAAKRRSGVPLPLKDVSQTAKPGEASQRQSTVVERTPDSAVQKEMSPPMAKTHSPVHNRLSALGAQSVPNLKAKADTDVRRDSKMPLALAATPEERPESFIADLPDPTTWTSKTSPISNTATMPLPLRLDPAGGRVSSDADSSAYQASQSRPLRSNSNSFSLPLRASIAGSSPPRTVTKQLSVDPDVLSPIPAVTTLTAKVDFGSRTTIDASHIPERKSSSPGSPPRSFTRSATSRLSLFPTSMGPRLPVVVNQPQIDRLQRSRSTQFAGPTVQVQAEGPRLARPTSLQVRADHAPFLASVRPAGAAAAAAVQPRTTTVPIRSLKPSRSVATMQTIRSVSSFTLNDMRLVEEESDVPTSLLGHMPTEHSGAHLHNRVRRGPRSRTSLPHLDFGIPLIGLGPPAPPPQTPLPNIPIPQSIPDDTTTKTPIGVAISQSADEEHDQPTTSPVVMGLGIHVG